MRDRGSEGKREFMSSDRPLSGDAHIQTPGK